PPGSESGLVSDFEDGELSARFGRGWTPSTDEMAGGSSTVKLEVVAGGANGSKHALRVSGEVKKGYGYPWAGAMFHPGKQPMRPVNLSSKKELAFYAKGDGKPCRVMIFADSRGSMPATLSFTPGKEWQQFVFAFTEFAEDLDGHDLTGIAFVSGSKPGPFSFDLDTIELR